MIPGIKTTGAFNNNLSLKQLVAQAGLLSNLKICCDAGHLTSYPGSGQIWYDISGNGYNFYLGKTSSSEATDPPFVNNGPTSYFSSSGGVGFECINNVTADSFVSSWHKTGAAFTLLQIEYWNGSNYGISWNTKSGNWDNDNVGINTIVSSNQIGSVTGNGSTVIFGTAVTLPSNVPIIVGFARSITSSTNRFSARYSNGTYASNTNTEFFSPSSSNCSTNLKFGLSSNDSLFISTGRRIYGIMAFNKVLSEAEFNALRTQFQKRWVGAFT